MTLFSDSICIYIYIYPSEGSAPWQKIGTCIFGAEVQFDGTEGTLSVGPEDVLRGRNGISIVNAVTG